MQQPVNNFKNAYDHFGLINKIQKTKMLEQPAPRTNLPEFNITISDTPAFDLMQLWKRCVEQDSGYSFGFWKAITPCLQKQELETTNQAHGVT